jgi:hypothetical protein
MRRQQSRNAHRRAPAQCNSLFDTFVAGPLRRYDQKTRRSMETVSTFPAGGAVPSQTQNLGQQLDRFTSLALLPRSNEWRKGERKNGIHRFHERASMRLLNVCLNGCRSRGEIVLSPRNKISGTHAPELRSAGCA